MKIELKKFGTTLTSRQLGKEAYAAFTPSLKEVKKDEIIEVVFEGVNTFTPSWADEFLTPLLGEFKDRVVLKKSNNLSVIETIGMLEQIHGYKFKVVE